MKISFNKRRLYTNLIIGTAWIVLSVSEAFALGLNNFNWTYYLQFVIGVLFIGHYIYDLKVQYMTIENGLIWKNRLFGSRREIDLSRVELIEQVYKSYVLKTETDEFIINTQLIDKSSLVKLNKILADLDLPSEKSIF